jgi:hypothetical protein
MCFFFLLKSRFEGGQLWETKHQEQALDQER